MNGAKEKANTEEVGTQTSEGTRTANMSIKNPNPVTKAYIRCKKLRKKVFYTKVYLMKEKSEVERM